MAAAVQDRLERVQDARVRHARLLFGSAQGPAVAEPPPRPVIEGASVLLAAADSARAGLLRKEQEQRQRNLVAVGDAITQLVDLAVEELDMRDAVAAGHRVASRRASPHVLLRQDRHERPLQLLANRQGLHLGWEQFPGDHGQLNRLREDLVRLEIGEVFATVPREVHALQEFVGTLPRCETRGELCEQLTRQPSLGHLVPPDWTPTPEVLWPDQVARLGLLLRERTVTTAARERQGQHIVSHLLWMPPSLLQHVWPHVWRQMDHGLLLRSVIQVGRALTVTEQWSALAGLLQVTAWLAAHHPSKGLRRAYWVQTDQLLGHRALRATGNQLTEVLGDVVKTAGLHRLQEHWLSFLLGRLAVSEDRHERVRLLPALRRLATESATLEHMLLDPRWYVVRNAIDVAAHGGVRRYWPMIRAARTHPEPRVQAMAEQVIADGLLPAE